MDIRLELLRLSTLEHDSDMDKEVFDRPAIIRAHVHATWEAQVPISCTSNMCGHTANTCRMVQRNEPTFRRSYWEIASSFVSGQASAISSWFCKIEKTGDVTDLRLFAKMLGVQFDVMLHALIETLLFRGPNATEANDRDTRGVRLLHTSSAGDMH